MTRLYYLEAPAYDVFENQALEKYLLENVEDDTVILYLWQNENCIVIGRNQDAYSECDLERFEKDGGKLARRITGGGAVYHDKGNLNFTFVCKKDLYDVDKQDRIILAALKSLGIDANKNGCNDLEIEGRKFSGHAYYKGKENCLHHGTLMLEVDEGRLSDYLNVSLVKLEARKVSSVRSRVINLKAVKPGLSIEDLKKALLSSFENEYKNKACVYKYDEEKLKKLKAEFADPLWRHGQKAEHEFVKEKRFSWGTLRLTYDKEDNILKDLAIYTDALNWDIEEKEYKNWLGKDIRTLKADKEKLRAILELLNEE